MKKFTRSLRCLLAVTIAAGALTFSGCKAGSGRYDAPTATYDPAAASDPVVVTAQNVRAQALDTFDVLWTTERQFRNELFKLSPEIKHVVDYTRKNAKTWLDDLTEQIRAYQLNRTAENRLKLEGAIRILQTAVAQASDYVAKARDLKNK